MIRINILDFIFYKFYRVSKTIKSNKPLWHSLGLMSTLFTMTLYIITIKLQKHGYLNNSPNVLFYALLLIIIFILLFKRYSKDDLRKSITDRYSLLLSNSANTISDVIAGGLFLLCIFSPAFIF